MVGRGLGHAAIRISEAGPSGMVGLDGAALRGPNGIGLDPMRRAFSESCANLASTVGGIVGRLLGCPILKHYTAPLERVSPSYPVFLGVYPT
jgi:hypothetical protein